MYYYLNFASLWARRKICIALLLTLNFALLIATCGLNIEDPTAPSPPRWIEKSLPIEWPERGIDAHESGGIYLEWATNSEENIFTYQIYRAEYFMERDSLEDYQLLKQLEVDSNSRLEYLDSSCKPRAMYYYKLTAQDISNNVSSFSDSVRYTLLPQVSVNSMMPNGYLDTLNPDRALSWGYSYSVEMEDYCITVLTLSNDFVCRVRMSPFHYESGHESWIIPNSIALRSDQIYKWRIDTGALYYMGYESAGSESAWATFLYTAP